MTTKNIHIMGIDPGGTTGWSRLTVPRDSIFGDASPEIVEWDHGEFTGPEVVQATNLARLVRETQCLDYKTGVALVVEDWDIMPTNVSRDPETLSPVRIGAMLLLLMHQRRLGDSVMIFQGRTQAKKTATDDRLHAWGLWVSGSDHIRDATRHAIVGLRRARTDPELAKVLWPY